MALALARVLGSRRHVGRLLPPSSYGLLSTLSTDAGQGGAKEVAVDSADGKRKRRWRSLLPRSWNHPRRVVPSLNEILQSGLGNAFLEATQNMSRVLENLRPSGIIGEMKMKEKDEAYKLRCEVPGLAKEDLRITIRDGVLSIVGEHNEEQGDESDDELWSAGSYGFYNASLALPDDAKHDDIKAELKDGVLTIIIPKDEDKAKQVKEVTIH